MRKLAFVGGIIVLPHEEVTGHAVIVEGEKIVAILSENDLPENIERISLDGDYLLPGFVDIHVHGGGGADFMDATPDAMRTVAATHCAHVTHMYCATTTEHKRGQVVHGGIVEAAYLEDGITIELIADGKHIPKETMRLGFRLKGKNSLALITDAIRAAGTDLQSTMLGDLQNGVPVIIEEGVAKLPDRSSYAGSIATMDHALRVVHGRYGIPLCDTVRAMSLTPARLVGADDRKGSIAPSKDADLVILTPDLTVRRVFVRGREFQQ